MSLISKKLLEIKEYRQTRQVGADNDFMLAITSNLLVNLSRRNNFIHKELRQYKAENKPVDDLLRIAAGLYVSSLVTCWETFFRDLFIFICNIDVGIKGRLEQENVGNIPLDLTVGEYVARKYNFQNLSMTKEAFDSIFKKNTQNLSEYFSEEVFNGSLIGSFELIFAWLSQGVFKEKVDDVLSRAFAIRHLVTHDANYLVDFDSELFSTIEIVFQAVPQYFIATIAAKYSQKRIVFNVVDKYVRITDNPSDDERSYAFSAIDFMANDYEVISDSAG